MARLVFTTVGGPWTADGETYSDLVEIDKPSKGLVRLASHAHAAGAIDVIEGLDQRAVQSQDAGEAAYAKAVKAGKWHEGNDLQHAMDVAAGVDPLKER